MKEAGASLLGTHRHPCTCSAVLASLRLWFDLFFPSLRAFPRDPLQDLGSQAGWGLPWCSHNLSWGCSVAVAAVAVSILRPFTARIPPFKVGDLVVYLAAQIIPQLWCQVTENRTRQQHFFTFCL